MRVFDVQDTIAALSTPLGESGIGIVRISGKEALKIADKVFVAKDGKRCLDFKTYTTHYGWIVEKEKGNPKEFIDEVILTVMRSPRSYTKEDVVEINGHGGIVALRRVLDLVLENGCRLAEPGEFTKRAFLNGRIDLAQAEAVLDIIRAKTDSALRVGTEQLKGGLSGLIHKIRATLLDILSLLEAGIDFPDEETQASGSADTAQKLKRVHVQLVRLLESSRQGRIFREGLRAVICGRPNVGKSSLLNALLRQERSIVTSIPGTTRDAIEEMVDIRGIPVRIVDTAGLKEPRGLVERKAVLRSKKHILSADLVILLFDGSTRLARQDEVLMQRLKGKSVIAVINKMDLKQRIDRARIAQKFRPLLSLSAKRAKNIDLLEDAIVEHVYQGKVSDPSPLWISRLRHVEALRQAKKLIAKAMESLDNKLPAEFVAQDLKDALACLDSIVGKKFSEDLLDKIFSEFCIGK
jgi:tRNA modification GTPase